MNELKNIRVDEISLVDEGANPAADVVLFKRKDESKVPESVEKALERLSSRLEQHIQKAENIELKKVASKYEILGENVDELAQILKSAKGTPAYDKLIGVLDKELDYVEKLGLYSELGKSGVNSSAVSIEKIAAQIRKENPSLSQRQALDKAFVLHPELQY